MFFPFHFFNLWYTVQRKQCDILKSKKVHQYIRSPNVNTIFLVAGKIKKNGKVNKWKIHHWNNKSCFFFSSNNRKKWWKETSPHVGNFYRRRVSKIVNIKNNIGCKCLLEILIIYSALQKLQRFSLEVDTNYIDWLLRYLSYSWKRLPREYE